MKKATLPLLLEQGPHVSTRQISQAAGVAEGTIFRVYPTKQDLINDVILDAISPNDVMEKISHLPPDQKLVDRVENILALITEWVTFSHRFMPMMQFPHPGKPKKECSGRGPHEGRHLMVAAIAESLIPYVDDIRVSPRVAATAVMSTAFAHSHASLVDAPASTAAEMAHVLLYGIASLERP